MTTAISDDTPSAGILSNDLTWSEAVDKIAPAYLQAQKNMGDVVKNASNPAFKSKYADLGAVIEAVLPAFNDAGIAVVQSPGASYVDGIEVTVQVLLLHTSGQWMRSRLAMKPTKTDPQAAGSAITYARRYQLQSLAGVAPQDDDGNKASALRTQAEMPRNGHPTMKLPDSIGLERADALRKLAVDAGLDPERIRKGVSWCSGDRVKTIIEMLPGEADKFESYLSKEKAKKAPKTCPACDAPIDQAHEWREDGMPCPEDTTDSADAARKMLSSSAKIAAIIDGHEEELPL